MVMSLSLIKEFKTSYKLDFFSAKHMPDTTVTSFPLTCKDNDFFMYLLLNVQYDIIFTLLTITVRKKNE